MKTATLRTQATFFEKGLPQSTPQPLQNESAVNKNILFIQIAISFLHLSHSDSIAVEGGPLTRDEAKKLVDDYELRRNEISQRNELRKAASRKRWFAEPRQSLYSMAHADDLTSFPNDEDTRKLFAPHALALAESEQDFMPLRVYAMVGFDRKDPEFARRVIQKAISSCPEPAADIYAQMLVPLVNLNLSVAELQDRPFFARLANDPNQHESVRKAASAVVAEIDRKASVTRGATDPVAGDPAKALGKDDDKTASKASVSESEWLWVTGMLLILIAIGIGVWRMRRERV